MTARATIAAVLALLAPPAHQSLAHQTQAQDQAQPAGVAFTPLAETLTLGTPADGSLPDLILIPGIGLSLEAWRPWMEDHVGQFRMHAVTLPGMAGTAPPPEPEADSVGTPWLHNAADAIAAYIRENGIERPVVIGHGTGGMVALHTGVRHPELIRAYASITMAPAVPVAREPLSEAERLEHAFAVVAPRNDRLDAEAVVAQLQSTYQLVAPPRLLEPIMRDIQKIGRHVFTRYWVEVVASDLIDEIAANETLPVLLCVPVGQNNRLRNVNQWHAIADACDSVILFEFDRSASFCHEEQPELFDTALRLLIERSASD